MNHSIRHAPLAFGLIAAIGCGNETAAPGDICALKVAPDRLTLLGRGAGSELRLFTGGEGPIESIEIEEAEWQLDAALLQARAGRLRAIGTGVSTVHVQARGCTAEIEVDIVDGPGPFGSTLLEYEAGTGGGFGASSLPEIVLGPPSGGGLYNGSLDVVSLGLGGTIAVGLGDLVAFDGPGADLIVFENAFEVSRGQGRFVEPGRVSVRRASDGEWTALPCARDVAPHVGCAGVAPVLAGPTAPDVDPTDLDAAGGDPVDLSGIEGWVDAVRILDVSDAGGESLTAGFDLDAVAIVHVLRADAVELLPSRPMLELQVGQTELLPRIDAVLADGRIIYGIQCNAELDAPDGTLELDGDVITALAPGRAELSFQAGPLVGVALLEVIR